MADRRPAKLVSNLHYSKGESVRHTGPSSLFRYFYQAGYEWVEAEQNVWT